MLRTILTIAACSLIITLANSQSKVGSNVLIIDPASMFEVESDSSGILPPRLTTAQRDAQTEWDEGHIIYNSTDHCLQVYNGIAWDCFVQGVQIDSTIYKYNDTLTSDRIVGMGGFQLTFDGSGDVVITDAGFVGIGDPTPEAKLDVEGGTVRLSDYGRGLVPGSESYLLGVDSEGDIIEVIPAIDTFSLIGDELRISLKGDTVSHDSVNLAKYLDNTDHQVIDSLGLVGTNLQIGLENDANGLQTLNLASLLDVDWYAKGGSYANNILDTIYTFGLVGINKSVPLATLHVNEANDSNAGPWVILEGGGNVRANTALQLYDKGTAANNETIIEFAHNPNTGVAAPLAKIRSNTVGTFHANGADLTLETTSAPGSTNTDQLVLKNDGNIGIGTRTPDELLHVAGDMRLDGAFEDKDGDAGTAGQVLTSTVTGTDWVDASTLGSDDQIIDSLGLNGNIFNIGLENDINGLQSIDLTPILGNSENIYSTSDSLEGNRIVTMDGNSLTFDGTGATGDVVVAANGNVGIGNTVSPSFKLDVNGSGLFRDGNNSNVNSKNQLLFSWNSGDQFKHALKTRHNSGNVLGNAIDFYLWDGGVDANSDVGTQHVMTIEGFDSGRVGIGTTNPNYDFQLFKNNAVGSISTSSESTDATLFLGTPFSGSDGAQKTALIAEGLSSWSRAKLHFALNDDSSDNSSAANADISDSKMTIQYDGNVGIGTTSPDTRLEVDGGSVKFSDYGVGTYEDNTAAYALGTDADGDVVEMNTLKNSRWFYAPAVTIDASSLVNGETIDLHQEYVDQMSSIPATHRNPSSSESIPTYGETELDYHVTYADATVIDIKSVSNTGILTYDIIDVPFDNYTIVNIVFYIK